MHNPGNRRAARKGTVPFLARATVQKRGLTPFLHARDYARTAASSSSAATASATGGSADASAATAAAAAP